MSDVEKSLRTAIACLESALTALSPSVNPVLCKAEGLLAAALLATKEAFPFIEDLT